jgi:hypothetical protein
MEAMSFSEIDLTMGFTAVFPELLILENAKAARVLSLSVSLFKLGMILSANTLDTC